MTGVRLGVLAIGIVLASAIPAAQAQDLFELEVFDADTVAPGRHDLELHTNVLSRGTVGSDSAAGDHRPAHVSIEVVRGWTSRFETAVFVQTAPFGSTGSARFAGGHVRGKVRLGGLAALPLQFAVAAEYAFNRPVFDDELQTLELRPIVAYVRGRLMLLANPSVELVTRGSDGGLAPVFDVSAGGAWQLTERFALTADYFSAAGTTRHLQPESGSHHLLSGGTRLEVGSGWEIGFSAGHCVTRREPWLLRSILGVEF